MKINIYNFNGFVLIVEHFDDCYQKEATNYYNNGCLVRIDVSYVPIKDISTIICKLLN